MKSDFLLAITQLAAERNLPKEIVFKAVESALLSAYRKNESIGNYDVSIHIVPISGEIKAYAQKTVVDSPTDTWHEIALTDARKLQKDAKIGDSIALEIPAPDAGRIGVQTAKQVVMQRLREAEREFILGTFAHREGDILGGVIQRVDARQVIVDLGKAEGVLPLAEQVRAEHYQPGQRLKVYLLEVSQTNKGPRLLLSRTHPNLVRRLFHLEVPEMNSGIVELKAVAREPGSRTKVAVAETQDGIDPVGSCIGLRGIRIQNIISEMQGEKIDVIQWHSDPKAYIANALSPAQITQVEVDLAEGAATAVVPDGQLSLAIGKEGQNVRLAAKLTGWKIDIKSSSAFEEEQAALRAQGIITEEIEEFESPEVVEEPEEEPIEELLPVEELIVTEPPIQEGPQIRFAEDILPRDDRDRTGADKSKKKIADEKPKGKKKAKRAKNIVEDEDFSEELDNGTL